MDQRIRITPSVTNPTISDIYERLRDNKLNLQPKFQRKFVWTQDHQEEFIDTILNGYPFPEIYVCQGEYDDENLRTTHSVIDGQQRLTTVKNYIEATFDKPLKKVTEFKKLSDEQRKNFMSYKLIMRDLGEVPDKLISEIFRRINLTKFKLENIEIQNAIYDGEYIQTAKNIASNFDLKQFGVFYDSEFTRMADIHFILQVMTTLQRGGYFNRDTEIEKCVSDFNDEFKNSNTTEKNILKTLNNIQKLKLPADSIWFRKSNFFTMVIELSIQTKHPKNLLDRLTKLENKIIENKNKLKTKYGLYYSYMYQGTNSRKARITRGDIFKKEIFS